MAFKLSDSSVFPVNICTYVSLWDTLSVTFDQIAVKIKVSQILV